MKKLPDLAWTQSEYLHCLFGLHSTLQGPSCIVQQSNVDWQGPNDSKIGYRYYMNA